MTQMGKSEARQMLTVVRKLCGHPVTGPSAVFDQSIARIKLPISPPPARNERGSESGAKFLPGKFIGPFDMFALQTRLAKTIEFV